MKVNYILAIDCGNSLIECIRRAFFAYLSFKHVIVGLISEGKVVFMLKRYFSGDFMMMANIIVKLSVDIVVVIVIVIVVVFVRTKVNTVFDEVIVVRLTTI